MFCNKLPENVVSVSLELACLGTCRCVHLRVCMHVSVGTQLVLQDRAGTPKHVPESVLSFLAGG